jgi:molecular chaperone GrpE
MKNENKELKKEIDKEKISIELENAKKKIEENENDLKRLQAEFENHIKRTDKEKINLCEFANANLIKNLIPVLEDFRSAIFQFEKNAIDSGALEGIKMIYKNFRKILDEEGLDEISSEGLADPFMHEVLLQKESDKPEGEIIQEVQKGYLLKKKVLKPAKVIVSKGKETEEKKDNLDYVEDK